MTYELVNRRTANTVACFAGRDQALEALRAYAGADSDFARDLVVLAFNSEGEAVEEPEAVDQSVKAA